MYFCFTQNSFISELQFKHYSPNLSSFSQMKVIFTKCLIFLYFYSINCDKNAKMVSRFRSIECYADNYTTIVRHCYIKAISRQIATMNLLMSTIRTVHKPIYVQLILYYRYGTIYRDVIDTKRIEWCSIMDGVTSHLFLMQTIEQVKKIAGFAFRKCPYKADNIEMKNVTIDDSNFFDVFPEGIYKLSWLNYNKTFDVMWSFNISVFIKSPLKESMGK